MFSLARPVDMREGGPCLRRNVYEKPRILMSIVPVRLVRQHHSAVPVETDRRLVTQISEGAASDGLIIVLLANSATSTAHCTT